MSTVAPAMIVAMIIVAVMVPAVSVAVVVPPAIVVVVVVHMAAIDVGSISVAAPVVPVVRVPDDAAGRAKRHEQPQPRHRYFRARFHDLTSGGPSRRPRRPAADPACSRMRRVNRR